MAAKYVAQIRPLGENQINNEIDMINKIPSRSEKLFEIMRWASQDFKNPWINDQFYCLKGDPLCRYYVASNGNISAWENSNRIYPFFVFNHTWVSPYKDDVYWIAYYKVGACQEMSILFSTIAKQTGFEVREVGINGVHAWVEVNDTNGEWIYADPQCYLDKLTKESEEIAKFKGINSTKLFLENCNCCKGTISITETGENITSHYY